MDCFCRGGFGYLRLHRQFRKPRLDRVLNFGVAEQESNLQLQNHDNPQFVVLFRQVSELLVFTIVLLYHLATRHMIF